MINLIGFGALIVVYTIFVIVLRAYTVSIMWGWFVVPLGVIPIKIWHAAGLMLFLSFFMERFTIEKAKFEAGKTTLQSIVTILRPITICLSVLLFGYMYHYFMQNGG